MRNSRRIINFILDILFPKACPICDRPVPLGEGNICKSCHKKIIYIKDPTCQKCGRQIFDETQIFCEECTRVKHEYTKGYALYDYRSICKSIYRFKYQNRRDYGKFFGYDIAQNLEEEIKRMNPDAIIPIPIHKERKRKRGFNQAQVIAKALGEKVDITVNEDLVKRVKNTDPLKNMDTFGRQNTLKNAFIIDNDGVKLKRVLLIDDVYTTGSTIDAVASILKDKGVGEVYYIALSIGDGV